MSDLPDRRRQDHARHASSHNEPVAACSRRGFLARSGLMAGAGSLTARVAWAGEESSDAPEFKLLSPPVLTNPSPAGVTVLWATSGPATGWVEYGETEQLGQRATGAEHGLLPYDDVVFKIRLPDLKPGTRYHYRVHAVPVEFRSAYDIGRRADEVRTSETFSFVTPHPAAPTARFTVWNDTHENAETFRLLHAARLHAHGSTTDDFLLWNGDQTNDIYAEDQMVGQFLAPAGQPFATTTPYYYVRGNHDARGPAARRLSRFTDVPGGDYYYSFRQGPLAALVLDTGEDKPDDHPVYGGLNDFAAYRARQAEWLAREIERPQFREAPIRILFCHIPLWWQDEAMCADGYLKWHDLLVAGGVQLVISGHTHQPGWFPAEKGRPYGQLVAGGPRPEAATYIRGHASPQRLAITHHRLSGDVLHEFEIA